jgi:hypothetical protein
MHNPKWNLNVFIWCLMPFGNVLYIGPVCVQVAFQLIFDYKEISALISKYERTGAKEIMTDWIHGNLFYDIYVPFHQRETMNMTRKSSGNYILVS